MSSDTERMNGDMVTDERLDRLWKWHLIVFGCIPIIGGGVGIGCVLWLLTQPTDDEADVEVAEMLEQVMMVVVVVQVLWTVAIVSSVVWVFVT